MEASLTPRAIVAALDQYIVGQAAAKRNVAVALRNRWRRMQVPTAQQEDIVPNNILMIGATGVGKTEIARRLAKISGAPFVKVEASKFTEVGYVGRDVESMVRDLMEQAINLVKAQKKEEVKEKARGEVERILLDTLIPPVHAPGKERDPSSMPPSSDQDVLNAETRERFREKIRNGDLDHRVVEITLSLPAKPGVGMLGGKDMDEAAAEDLREMFSNFLPKQRKKRKVTIAEAKKILLEEEAAKLIDMDRVKDEAAQKAQYTGIIFIDEIDKVASSSAKGGGPDVSREGVQRDLLPIVEGTTVNTKHGPVKTDHILFVAAGAFHVSKPSDLIPELQGRFPIRVELSSLTEADFLRILQEPQNSLMKQYQALFAAEGVTLTFKKGAMEELAAMAFRINETVENIGARRLHTVMSRLLNDWLFAVPDELGAGTALEVTVDLVKERLAELVQHKDMSQYIL